MVRRGRQWQSCFNLTMIETRQSNMINVGVDSKYIFIRKWLMILITECGMCLKLC